MPKEKNNGITLVALVITIIILLILAGITISQLTGSGLFERAREAEEKYRNAKEKEDGILTNYENVISSQLNNYKDKDSSTEIGIEYIKDGLTLWYDGIEHGNENNGIWKDLSGNNNNGTLENFEFSETSGWKDKGLLFDGTNDKVKFRGDITENYTISLLVQPTNFDNKNERLIAESPFPTLYISDYYSDRISFYGQGQDTVFSNTKTMSKEEKTMITITYDGTAIKLYENNDFISQISTTQDAESVVNAYLGGREDDDRQYTGYIYNCMIYDRVLNIGEISNNYNANILRYDMEEQAIYLELIDNTKKLVNIHSIGLEDESIIEYKIGEGESWALYEAPFEYTDGTIYARIKDKNGEIIETIEANFEYIFEVERHTDTTIKLNGLSLSNQKSIIKYEVYINDKKTNIDTDNESYIIDKLNPNTEYDVQFKIYFQSGNIATFSKKCKTLNEGEYYISGLQLWYDGIEHGNENNGIWKDLSGNNNDGTLQNFDFSETSGWKNNGLLFDGKDDKVKFKGDITENYTISLLVQPTSFGMSNARFIAERPFPCLYIGTNNGSRIAFYGQGKDTTFSNTNKISTDVKTDITITYDGTSIKLYENGKYISSLSTTTKPSSVIDAYLGGRADNDRQFTGYIYNCMIYNKALDADIVRYTYEINQTRYQ